MINALIREHLTNLRRGGDYLRATALGDPQEGGLQSNGCPFAPRTIIFVSALLSEQAPHRSETKMPPTKSGDIHLIGGEGGILTPGGVTLNGFRERHNQPLCHL